MEEIKKSLWHAFDVLDESSKVNKSRVRVVTNNIGNLLNVDKAETIWDKISDDVIDFDTFYKTLCGNLLVGIDKSDPELINKRAEVTNLCWMLCEQTYNHRLKEYRETTRQGEDGKLVRDFTTTDLFKLWKIFNFLCEHSSDGLVLYPLRADIEETERIAAEICKVVGLPVPKQNIYNENKSHSNSFLQDYCQFVSRVAEKLGPEHPKDVISQGITEVNSQIISDIVKKGYMVKFGNKVTAWKDRWFVLTPGQLRYYVSHAERDLKGTVVLCKECFTQTFPDKQGGRQNRFKLHTPLKQYELSAPDLKSKNEWMSDIKRVVLQIGVLKESLQRTEWKERKKEREDRRRSTAEEELRRIAEREKLLERERELEEERQQRLLAQEGIKERERLLELERQKRQDEENRRQRETDELLETKRKEIEAEKLRCAETEKRLQEERENLLKSNMAALEAEREQRAKVEERLAEEEERLAEERLKLKELEEAKKQLEDLVEIERSLKEDEEMVRKIQSQILEDEIAKREELERLQREQKTQLKLEQINRLELEEENLEQEEKLREARRQLEELTRERQDADSRMTDAEEKLRKAEEERRLMEERLKLKEMKNFVGLARPLAKKDPDPFITHRGKGAFTEADFTKNGDILHETTETHGEFNGDAENVVQDYLSDEPEK